MPHKMYQVTITISDHVLSLYKETRGKYETLDQYIDRAVEIEAGHRITDGRHKPRGKQPAIPFTPVPSEQLQADADRLYDALLDTNGNGLTRKEQNHLFGGTRSSKQLSEIRQLLINDGDAKEYLQRGRTKPTNVLKLVQGNS